jgi:hypothetical protein
MRIMILGSRNYHDYDQFRTLVDPVIDRMERQAMARAELICGTQEGTDEMSRKYAELNGYKFRESDDLYNEISVADAVIAFRNSGHEQTNAVVNRARSIGIPVTLIQITA